MTEEIRANVSPPPEGFEKLKWFGPSLLWALSSIGSGAVLFTPRVGARYGYSLLWIAAVVIFFQWVWIREIARFTLVTGRTIFDGYGSLPGPKGWAIWLIAVPQLFAAVFSVSGLAALVGSALMLAFPGKHLVYSLSVIIGSILLVVSGGYRRIERITSVLAGFLVITAVITAMSVFPEIGKPLKGLIPRVHEDFDFYFLLPWIGFMLAGAAGILWYSYWTLARGFAGGPSPTTKTVSQHEHGEFIWLKKWLSLLSVTSATGVLCASITMLSFLVLGTELLQPTGLIPSGIQVAADLTRLFDQIWGKTGYWIIILGIFIALSGSVLANQDGWGRTFADATLILSQKNWNRKILQTAFSIVVTTLFPITLLLIVQDPLPLMSIAGIITAVHMPVIIFLTLYLNLYYLPKTLQPSRFIVGTMLFSGGLYVFLAAALFSELGKAFFK